FEEDRQRIGRVETPKPGRLIRSRAWREKPGSDQDCGEGADRSEGQGSLVDPLSKRFQHQNRHAKNEHGDLERGRRNHGRALALKYVRNAGATIGTNVCGKNPNQRSAPTSSVIGTRKRRRRSTRLFQRSPSVPMNALR